MWKFTVKWPISDQEPGRESKLTRQERLIATEALQDVFEALPNEIREGIEHVDIWWREPCGAYGYRLIFCFKGGWYGSDGFYASSYYPVSSERDRIEFVKGVIKHIANRLLRDVCSNLERLGQLKTIANVLLSKPEYQDDVKPISNSG